MNDIDWILRFVEKLDIEEDLRDLAEDQASSHTNKRQRTANKINLMDILFGKNGNLVEDTLLRRHEVKRLQFSSFQEFKKKCIEAPLRNLDEFHEVRLRSGIRKRERVQFAKELFCTPETVEKINKVFDHYCRAFFRQWTKGPGAPKKDKKIGSIVPLHNEMSYDAWMLFGGVQKEEKEYTYKDMYQIQSAENFEELRSNYKQFSFLDYMKQRTLSVGSIDWCITTKFDVPSILPTKNNWYNSRAVLDKSEDPFLEEKVLLGRIVHANSHLYKKFENYKRIIPLLYALDQVLAPVSNEEYCLVWRWFTGNFLCFQPCHRLNVIPVANMGYCLFMVFDKSIVRNTSEVYLPKWVTVASFSGEVKPNNFRREDCYSTALNEDPAKVTTDQLMLVVDPLAEGRAGVGGVAFMANHTCQQNAFFTMYRNEYGSKEGNGWNAKGNYMFQIDVLKASTDIRGKDIIEISNRFTESYKHKTMENLLQHDKYYFPVEFNYFNKNEDPRLRVARYSTNGKILCSCLLHCYYLPPRLRSKVPLINKKLSEEKLEQFRRKTSLTPKQKEYVHLYKTQRDSDDEPMEMASHL